MTSQAIDHPAVLGEREALARDRWACEIAAQTLAPVLIVDPERDLGVQREAVEGGAQLAGQSERPCVAAADAGLWEEPREPVQPRASSSGSS